MVRVYKRTYRHVRKGKNFNPYTSYSQENLDKAIAEIMSGATTLTNAAKTYNIPKSTLSRKRRGLKNSQKKAGHPTLFTSAEEKSFIASIKILSDWGFPFDCLDLRVFAQKYLNKMGKIISSLKDNMPGVDWAKNFLIRHNNEISNQLAENISTDRAKLTEEVLDSFFENYKITIEGVSPDCIINYDETNLTDDPGNKKYIYKRGTKYPERVINSSKSAISLMFSGTADGTLLPVYIVYKAEHIWDSWIEGGPDKTRYNRSRSGWFDGVCFEDWFNKIIVPYAKKKSERIVIIGDNLSSHFSETILTVCEKFNISFICLPPKSTHILQPLDVAFYAPLKHYWRQILTEWKKREGRKHKTLIKPAFPRLLNQLVNKLMDQEVGSKKIKAGFEKCGLYPVNVDRPKSRLPQTRNIPEEEVKNATSDVIINMLQEMRGVTAPTEVIARRKRCDVAPGKSITADDLRKNPTNLTKGKINRKQSKRDVSDMIAENSDSLMSDIAEENFDRESDVAEVIEFFEPKPSTSTGFISEPKSSTSTGFFTSKPKLSTSSGKLININKLTQRETRPTVREKKNRVGFNSAETDKDAEALRQVRELSIKAAYSERKKRKRSWDSISTTSVSDLMSEHNDSDIIGVMSDRDDDFHCNVLAEETYPPKRNKGKGKGKKTVLKDIHVSTENEDKENLSKNISNIRIVQNIADEEDTSLIEKIDIVDDVDLVSVKTTIEPIEVVTEQNDDRDKKPDTTEKFTNDDTENLDKRSLPNDIDDNIEKNQINVLTNYVVNDKVLVRYYQKKTWKYYIGFVENIEHNNCYKINFLKTIKKPNLKFIITKKIDRDVVPAISIVKNVEIIQNDKQSQESNLSDESDTVYFC